MAHGVLLYAHATSTTIGSPAGWLSLDGTNDYRYIQVVVLGVAGTNYQSGDMFDMNLTSSKTIYAKADTAADSITIWVLGCVLDL